MATRSIDGLLEAGLSAQLVSKPQVSLGKFGNKKTGILAAFTGSDFNIHGLHFWISCNGIKHTTQRLSARSWLQESGRLSMWSGVRHWCGQVKSMRKYGPFPGFIQVLSRDTMRHDYNCCVATICLLTMI